MLTFLGDLIKGWYIHLGYGGIVLAMALESCLLPLPQRDHHATGRGVYGGSLRGG